MKSGAAETIPEHPQRRLDALIGYEHYNYIGAIHSRSLFDFRDSLGGQSCGSRPGRIPYLYETRGKDIHCCGLPESTRDRERGPLRKARDVRLAYDGTIRK